MGRGRLPGWSALLALLPCAALAQPCSGVVYLTFDTGNMRHAELIAETLRKHDVKATFFLANERTARGDYSLDASWGSYWKQRADEGHAFGSHTWRHGRIGPDTGDGHMKYRPAFGADEGRSVTLSPQDFCAELKRPDEALRAQTGRGLDAIWRAPGGRTTPAAAGRRPDLRLRARALGAGRFPRRRIAFREPPERSAAGAGPAQRA